MNINVCRIDDRLIHGQIVTKWIKEANAKMIMVVDDKAASDKMLQTILKFAVPAGIQLQILNKEVAVKTVAEDTSNTNVLMLVRNPKEANLLVEMGMKLDSIIVGNISNSKSKVGRTQLLDYIYVEPDDVEALKSLNAKGVRLEVKAVPEERAKDCHIDELGFVLYYTNQCPFNAKYVSVIENVSKDLNIAFKAIHLDTKEKAQNAPTPITTYALFYNGEYVTNDVMNEKKFIKLLSNLGL